MVAGVRELAESWAYDVISIGYPGRVAQGRIVSEPRNLAPGWRGFDFQAAFGRPVKLMNDAAMQALGSYEGGLLLFVGLGTGLGSALVADGIVIPMEVGQLSYKKGTCEDYLGVRAIERIGKKRWREYLDFGMARLINTFHPDDVVLGGGEAKRLKTLPPGCRLGNNANAFLGGFRLWERGTKEREFHTPDARVPAVHEAHGERGHRRPHANARRAAPPARVSGH
jgi:polyphosphate glucokinase